MLILQFSTSVTFVLQDIDSPANDFSEVPPGLLPLHTMVYFARKHEDQYRRVF